MARAWLAAAPMRARCSSMARAPPHPFSRQRKPVAAVAERARFLGGALCPDHDGCSPATQRRRTADLVPPSTADPVPPLPLASSLRRTQRLKAHAAPAAAPPLTSLRRTWRTGTREAACGYRRASYVPVSTLESSASVSPPSWPWLPVAWPLLAAQPC